jgi:hypothetical protein
MPNFKFGTKLLILTLAALLVVTYALHRGNRVRLVIAGCLTLESAPTPGQTALPLPAGPSSAGSGDHPPGAAAAREESLNSRFSTLAPRCTRLKRTQALETRP